MLRHIYLILYILHIIYGPYFYRFWLNNKPAQFKAKNIKEIMKYSIYITYVGFLYTIYFLTYPSVETFLVALFINLISLISYITVFQDSDYYNIAVIDHILLLLPFIYYKYHFNIKLTPITYITVLLLLVYIFTYKDIYIS